MPLPTDLPRTEQHPDWTAEMARALPDDGNRYEVLDGELFVTPAPGMDHQGVVIELAVRLREYVRAHSIGRVMLSPADIEFEPRRLVQPDVFVIPQPEASTARVWRDVRRLLLAVEVLSPTTARADRHGKRLIYQGQGVPEYWIIDPDARLVERWTPEDARPEILVDAMTWQPSPDIAPLRFDLQSLFEEAIGPR